VGYSRDEGLPIKPQMVFLTSVALLGFSVALGLFLSMATLNLVFRIAQHTTRSTVSRSFLTPATSSAHVDTAGPS